MGDSLNLLRVPADRYDGNYAADRLDLYQMFVKSADTISGRRQTANSFFLALNTGVLGFVELLADGTSDLTWAVAAAGLVLCLIWHRLIRSYRDLNSAKFAVIHQIEQELPLALYDAEWEFLGRGENSARHLPFTVIERWVPLIFAVLHGLVLAQLLGVFAGLAPAG